MAAGLVAIPSLHIALGARETDFKHFEIETEPVSHLSFAVSDVAAESERRALTCQADHDFAPLRIEERDALHNEKVRRARMRGGERNSAPISPVVRSDLVRNPASTGSCFTANTAP